MHQNIAYSTEQFIFNKPQLSLLKKPFKDICLF